MPKPNSALSSKSEFDQAGPRPFASTDQGVVGRLPFLQRLYIIRNGRITPDPKQVERGLSSIAVRAIGSMFKVSGINDLWRLYLTTIHDEIEFRYISIPLEYKGTTEKQFNETEMVNQYNFGEKMAEKGIPWMTTPPAYTPK